MDDDEALVLEFDNEASGRTAVIADEGDSVWLYLTHPSEAEFERDCWLFNKPSAPPEPEPAEYEQQSLPPPAPARFIEPAGVRACPAEPSFRVRWSADGHAVAVSIDGVGVGVAAMALDRGISRHLREAGPWGEPWDEARVNALI